MAAKTFLDDFATVADAPGGVQRLRELVLRLALRGQIVAPDTTDEPVSSLLKFIDMERTDAIRTYGWRTGRSAGAIRNDEVPWSIPEHWAWVRLEQVALPQAGFAFKSNQFNQVGRGVPLIRIRDIGRNHTECHFEGEYREEFLVRPGDYLVGMDGNFNIRQWQGAIALLNQRVTRLIFYSDQVEHPFVTWALQDRINALHGSRAYTTVQHLSGKQIAAAVIPVPPRAEQERIVAKVDELMRLCDELDARQERRHRATTRYRGSALHALTVTKTPDDLLLAWERVSNNWQALTEHREHIDALRPTVLQLAFHGRLVGRLDDEGGARDAIEQIERQRMELAQEGLIAKPKARTSVEPTAEPFDIPDHWSWVHVEDIVTHIVDCLHRTPPYSARGYPAIRTCDVEPGRLLLDQALLVDEATFREQIKRLAPVAGDVLYSREGGRYGIAAVVPPGVRLCLSQRMMQFRCADAVVPEFFSWFLNSPLGFGQASDDVGGSASPHVNIKSIRRFLVPLPPTGEQMRIVATLERVLSQVDYLGAATAYRAQLGARLAHAAVFTGVQSKGSARHAVGVSR